jgi:hypothetical protein
MGRMGGRIIFVISLITAILITSASCAFATPPSTAKGGHSSSGASSSSTSWYFADGYTGWQNYIAIRSVSEYDQQVELYFYDSSGQIGHTLLALGPSRRGTVYVNGVIGNNKEYSCSVYGQFGLVAERSMYIGNEGTCGSGSKTLINKDATNPWWSFGDVYSDSSSISYIEVYNADLTKGAYMYIDAYYGGNDNNTVETIGWYMPAKTRRTAGFTGGSPRNRVARVRSTGTNRFMAERSYVKGSMATSNGGTWRKQNDLIYFAEGYSTYPTWFVTGFTDGWGGSGGAYIRVDTQHIWNSGSTAPAANWIYTGSSLSRSSSGVPGGTNYGTKADRVTFSQTPLNPYYFNTERTTQYGQWATSSEGRNGYDVANYDFLFAECYTGHDVYLTFYNASAYSNVIFHIWVTSETAENWSFDVTISKAGSVKLQDLGVPWNRNCSIHVKPVGNRWPVCVERSSYFN